MDHSNYSLILNISLSFQPPSHFSTKISKRKKRKRQKKKFRELSTLICRFLFFSSLQKPIQLSFCSDSFIKTALATVINNPQLQILRQAGFMACNLHRHTVTLSPHTQRSERLGLMLCCCHPEILLTFEQKTSHFFFTRLRKLYSWFYPRIMLSSHFSTYQ